MTKLSSKEVRMASSKSKKFNITASFGEKSKLKKLDKKALELESKGWNVIDKVDGGSFKPSYVLAEKIEQPSSIEEKPNKKAGCLKALFMIIILSTVIAMCTGKSTTTEPTKIKAQTTQVSSIDKEINNLLSKVEQQPYYVLSSRDISHATRSRYHTFIYSPSAKTNDQLLATAASVAKKIQVDNRVQYSSVVIFDSEEDGTPYLSVDFAPDRKGISGEEDTGSRFKVEWINKLPE